MNNNDIALIKPEVLLKYDRYISQLKEVIAQERHSSEELRTQQQKRINKLHNRLKRIEDNNDVIFRSLIEYIIQEVDLIRGSELELLLRQIDGSFPNYEDPLEITVALRKYIKNNIEEK